MTQSPQAEQLLLVSSSAPAAKFLEAAVHRAHQTSAIGYLGQRVDRVIHLDDKLVREGVGLQVLSRPNGSCRGRFFPLVFEFDMNLYYSTSSES